MDSSVVIFDILDDEYDQLEHTVEELNQYFDSAHLNSAVNVEEEEEEEMIQDDSSNEHNAIQVTIVMQKKIILFIFRLF